MKLEELEVAAQSEDFSKPLAIPEQTQTALLDALDMLQEFQEDPLSLTAAACGSREVTRSGMKRQIEFVEVMQEDGITLVIEVYTK